MAAPKRFRTPVLAFSLALTTGCAQLPKPSGTEPAQPQTLYDSVLFDSHSSQPVTIDSLTRALASTDVVVIGEYHGHQASHLLQARLQQQLYQQRPRQVLTLEQFNLDDQPALNSYLAGMTGETEMIEDANAWDNYRASYRPLAEFARRHDLPVFAARSEEHTSELQSRPHLVCRLLLEKKKNVNMIQHPLKINLQSNQRLARQPFARILPHPHASPLFYVSPITIARNPSIPLELRVSCK